LLALKRSLMPSAPPTQKAGIMPTKIAFEWKSGMQA
jgi:hypothetical protein